MQNPWPNFIKCKLHSICRTVSFNFTDETTINALHCSLKISYYLEKKIAFQMLSKSLHTCSIFYSTTCKGIPFFFNTLKWVYLDLRLFCLGFLCICVIQSFIILIFTFYVPLQVKWKKKHQQNSLQLEKWFPLYVSISEIVMRIAIIIYAWNQLEVRVNSNVSTLM